MSTAFNIMEHARMGTAACANIDVHIVAGKGIQSPCAQQKLLKTYAAQPISATSLRPLCITIAS